MFCGICQILQTQIHAKSCEITILLVFSLTKSAGTPHLWRFFLPRFPNFLVLPQGLRCYRSWLPNKPERGGLTPTVIGLMFTTWTGKMSYGYLWFMMGGKYVLKSAICSYMDYFFLFRIWKKKLNFLPLTTGPSLNIIRIYIILNIIYYVWYMFIIFKYVYWCILHLLYM